MCKTKLYKTSKLLCILLLCLGFSVHSTQAEPSGRFDGTALDKPLIEILNEFGEKYQVFFSYEATLLEKINVDFEFRPNEGLEQAIDRLMAITNLQYDSFNQKYFVIYQKNAKAKKDSRKVMKKLKQIDKLQQKGTVSLQQKGRLPDQQLSAIVQAVVELKKERIITGTVKDVDGNPLIGATVQARGSNTGTITDFEGSFSVTVPDDATALIVSYVGYATLEVELAGRTTFDLILREDTSVLDEVVVIGYGTQQKKNLTGAVDQVSADVFENRPMSNLTVGLQGVLPNLNITLQDGKPNQAPSYNIRGTTSIGQGGDALVLIDGVEGDPSLINPNDIESVSLLKDAASAAIYGARGTFGVVLITTKNPTKGKTSITYSGNTSFKSPVVRPEYVTDGYTWSERFNEATVNWEGSLPSKINKTMRFSQEYLAELKYRKEHPEQFTEDWAIDPANGEYVYYSSTDVYGELYKNHTAANEHNVTVSGSSEQAGYMITGRYFGQEGIFRYNSDDYSMLNFRAKGSVQVLPWLEFENNTQYSNMKYHNPLNVGEGGGIWRNIADEGFPMSPIFNPDGTLTHTSAYNVGDFWYGKNGIDSDRRVLRNTTGFVAKLYDNSFRITGNFTFQNTDNNEKRRRVPVPYDKSPGVTSYVGTSTNDLQSIQRETQYVATNLYGEYEKTFKGVHYFKAMAGVNYEQSTYNRLESERNGLIFEDASDINLALGQDINVVGGFEKWAIFGSFSRINYSYKDRYLLEFNGRYDGSSKFPANERFAFFPSLSAGWRISNESFWGVSDKFISGLKLRGSYGSLGNGNIASYVYQEQFSIVQSDDILGGTKPQTTSRPEVLPDGLTWETSTTTNIGLDIGFLSNRLTFVADWYIRQTTDMFTIGRTLPAVFGATAPKGNYADLETKGFEISMLWRDRFDLGTKPFHYDVRITLADNRSVITKYNNPEKILSDYYEGMVIGEIWGYTNDGYFVDQSDIDGHADQSQFKSTSWGQYFPGDVKFMDTNGDGAINPGTNRLENPGDRSIIGNSAPRYLYGIRIGADWNNFFLTTFFQGVAKQDWWPSTEASVFWGQYNRPYNPLPAWHLDNYWTPDNPNAYLPRYVSRLANRDGGILREAQTKYLQNIAYIRMKNFQLGYNLPSALIGKMGIQSARIYFTGENLWTWSPLYKITKDLDVENTGPSDQVFTSGNAGDGYNYPMMKSVSFGLTVNF
ncbi:MAG: SusC/RagA family TonB-linked outer membrane protein [Lewinella sp.]|nr:SusC/RagA family TonB-linked outer membrane protein [Lewinella sp.]